MQHFQKKTEEIYDRIKNYPSDSQRPITEILHELRVYQIELEVQNSELHATNFRLQTIKDQFQTLFDAAPIGYLVLNSAGKIQQLNKTFKELTNNSASVGDIFYTVLHPDDQQLFLSRWRSFRQKKRTENIKPIEARLRHNPFVWVEIKQGHFTVENEQNTALVIEDISQRKQAMAAKNEAEQKLLHSQKMESVGQLAGGIAHDFNNQLHVIGGYAEILQHSLEDPTLLKYLAHISESIGRSKKLIDQLLSFSRKKSLNVTDININTFLQKMNELITRTFDPRIGCRINLAPHKEIIISGDPDRFQNAILNICINARDAIPGLGTIEIRADSITKFKDWVSIFGTVRRSGTYLMLQVIDDGVGMSPETVSRAVEPFFSTKGNKGTGLGLSEVYGLINSMDGDLIIESKEAVGTTISLLIPLKQTALASMHASKPYNTKSHHPRIKKRFSETKILVVDDNKNVLELSENYLKLLGFTVFQAFNGLEAISLLQEHKGDFFAVLLDMKMPVMGGLEVLKRMKPVYEDLPFIVLSGYSDPEDLDEVKKAGAMRVLQKPYTFAQLKEIILKIKNRKQEQEGTIQE